MPLQLFIMVTIPKSFFGFLAGAIWTATMPDNLAKYLPQLNDDQRAQLFGDISSVLEFPLGHPTREGVILGKFVLLLTFFLISIILTLFSPFSYSLFLWFWGDGSIRRYDASDDYTCDGS